MLWFKTPEEKILHLMDEISSLEKEIESLWKLEWKKQRESIYGYVNENRDEIISLEMIRSDKKKQIRLIRRKQSVNA